ncbi:MAG: coproporphyrinogen III oxidase family protein [Planctomycetes bacterium]|nr:coproporphyrinogen III oxidase family protein [Planctomycetota bacterium]
MRPSLDSSRQWVRASPSDARAADLIQDCGPETGSLRLYTHIPYCRDRCTYCAFATVADDPAQHEPLVEGLILEASRVLPTRTQPPATVYLGGGTPGLIAPNLLGRLLNAVCGLGGVDSVQEVTLEVNPSNVSASTLSAWADLGITRLSVGVQTFRDDILRWLARRHDASTARRALTVIAESWPSTWSADLLVGWSGARERDVSRDTCELMRFSPPHVSVYSLTVEPETPLARLADMRDVVVHDDQMELYDTTWSSLLVQEGLERYEVSNFARPGHRSIHNAGYWDNLDYFGLGPGASSSAHPLRWSNERDPRRYLDLLAAGHSPRAACERISPFDRLLESLAVGLRTRDGLAFAKLGRRFGPACETLVTRAAETYVREGFLSLDDGRLHLPARHLPRADRIITELVRSLVAAGQQPTSGTSC